MNTREFVELSSKLFTDLKYWVAEASKDESLSPSDLAILQSGMKIVERVTLRQATPDSPGT